MNFRPINKPETSIYIKAMHAIPGVLYEVVDVPFTGEIVLIIGTYGCKAMVSLSNPEHYWDELVRIQNPLLLRPLPSGTKFEIEQE